MTSQGRDLRTDLAEVVRMVSTRSGLDLDGCHSERMVGTVRAMWRNAGTPRADQYGRLLDGDPGSWDALIDQLTIRETYFFRDRAQLQTVRSVVGAAASATGAPVQVWTAGCASGEEPYTLAIMLDEDGVLDRCRIHGTDLSNTAIERARAARYGRWSLRRCDPLQREAYFHQEGESFQLRRRFAGAVTFERHNLLAGPPRLAAFDVVLCRNVLLYLTGEALQQAAVTLRDALRPGGWLFLGPSDPLPPTDGLEQATGRAHGAYRRIGAEGAREPTAAFRGPVRGGPPRSQPPPRPSRVARPPTTDDVAGSAAEVKALAAAGDREAAERLMDQATGREPLDAELRYLAAALHLRAGRPEAAAAAARAAVYLDGSLAVAHLMLGRAEQLCGNTARARRSFATALELLNSVPADTVVPLAEGERAGPLAATAALLANG